MGWTESRCARPANGSLAGRREHSPLQRVSATFEQTEDAPLRLWWA